MEESRKVCGGDAADATESRDGGSSSSTHGQQRQCQVKKVGSSQQSINQSLHLIATLVVAIFSGHKSIQDVLDILTIPPLRALSRSHPAMATNGTQVFAPVLAALQTMQSNVDRAQKGQAHEFLEQFQKSVRRFHLWSTV